MELKRMGMGRNMKAESHSRKPAYCTCAVYVVSDSIVENRVACTLLRTVLYRRSLWRLLVVYCQRWWGWCSMQPVSHL